jgi:NAD(P)-dependent dehydrogenase (short-subunit alcohol dehydrogenase family)
LSAGLIESGQTVLGCGRSERELAELSKKFRKPNDFDTVDVSVDQQVSQWAERLLAVNGPPDLLINNAAAINANRRLWLVPRDEADQVIDVNVKGMVNVLRHFLPAMVKRKSGVIVNISSGWGRSVAPDLALYCASKWAVEGLTRALAAELPKGMAAVPLNPGIIDTAMLRSCFGKDAANYPGPEEWSRRAVPFLLSLGPTNNGRPATVPDAP